MSVRVRAAGGGAAALVVRERLLRVRRVRGAKLADELLVIGRRCAALPVNDKRQADEILGYDEHGLPG